MPKKTSPAQVASLFRAIRLNDADQMRALLKKTGLEGLRSQGRSPLAWAAENGSLECLQELIGRDEIDALTLHHNTGLSLAAYFGFEDCVRLLLQAKARADIPDTGGNSALMNAAIKDQEACVRLLLPMSDPHALNNQGLTVVGVAAAAGSPRSLRFLIPLIGDETGTRKDSALELAVERARNLEAISWLAERASNRSFELALSKAARRGRSDIFETLLRCGPKDIFARQATRLINLAKGDGHAALATHLAGIQRSMSESESLSQAVAPSASASKPRL